MENRNKQNPMKSFTKIITDSSQRFLASFLDDSLSVKKEHEKLKKLVQLAIAQGSMIVIQVSDKDAANSTYQTLYGKVRENKKNANMIVLIQQKDNKIKMIPIEQVKKISVMGHNQQNKGIAK